MQSTMTQTHSILIACCLTFFLGMWTRSFYTRYASGKPLRLLLRQVVRGSTDWFFQHIVRIRPNRFLEYVSASGLLAVVAGKIAIVIAGYWYEIASSTGYILACAATAGVWQLHAVMKRDTDIRFTASCAAFWAWSSVLVVMSFHFFHTPQYALARVILEFVIPLSLAFWLVNFVQMFVLMRYAMYPEQPREIVFFYTVLSKTERRFSGAFKIPREVQSSINADVQEVAEEMNIGTRA